MPTTEISAETAYELSNFAHSMKDYILDQYIG